MTAVAGQSAQPALDPTVPDPLEVARIQASLGVSLQDVDPKVMEHIVSRSKAAGNEAFRRKDYRGESETDGNCSGAAGRRRAALLQAAAAWRGACWCLQQPDWAGHALLLAAQPTGCRPSACTPPTPTNL